MICQSSAANVAVAARMTRLGSNATVNQRFTVMTISGLRYQINTLISNRDDRCTREGKLVDKSTYSNISMSRGLDNYLDRAERTTKEIGGLKSGRRAYGSSRRRVGSRW